MSVPTRLIQKAKKLAYEQIEKHGVPPVSYLELSNQKGQWLAEKLKADKNIVLIGTLLMDCQLGKALKENKIENHVEMGVKKSKEILDESPELDQKIKENILHCVKEHHGVNEFYSLESEICCNADCYRFASVEGFLAGVSSNRDMLLEKRINFLSSKADEKWNALSIEICKKELKPQYQLIKKMIEVYNTSQ